MRYYRLYRISDLPACGSKKVVDPTFRQVALISTWGREMGNDLFLRGTHNGEICLINDNDVEMLSSQGVDNL